MQNLKALGQIDKIEAFRKIHQAFQDIRNHEKCRTCSCFYADVLNKVYDRIKNFLETGTDPEVAQIEHDFGQWLAEADPFKMHG